jgi:hypothetical protein
MATLRKTFSTTGTHRSKRGGGMSLLTRWRKRTRQGSAPTEPGLPAAHDVTRRRSAGPVENPLQDPTRGRSAGTAENPERDPTRAQPRPAA